MRTFLVICLGLAVSAPAFGGNSAPLADPQLIQWSHAPFETGECEICHESSDPQNPGPIVGTVNQLCFGCHDMFAESIADMANIHSPVEESCTNCHNPHNSSRVKLLNEDIPELCGGCHDDVLAIARNSPVQHQPVLAGQACLKCHDPHASNVKPMLVGLPYDLCVRCHGKDDMKDSEGKPMANLQYLVTHSHMLHGPVADKDCSACHLVHGGENFRMLLKPYPSRFYSPYDAENYELCFSCHEIDAIESQRTTTLTGFRDGSRNLHYVHVDKERRGRTCRACHEVHAAPQDHMIRDGVPYGPRNWILKINYTKTENGGSCAKTCHPTKTYDRTREN